MTVTKATDPIIHPLTHVLARLSRAEQLQLMHTHPLFTGKCPCCGTAIVVSGPNSTDLACHACDWQDVVSQTAA